MHYRIHLFTRGAQQFHPYKKRSTSSHLVHYPRSGYGMHNTSHSQSLDNHLLSLIKGVSRLSTKSKPHHTKRKTYGKGLCFNR